MPYTIKEGVMVALYNAGLHEQTDDLAEKVIHNLAGMGFAVMDVHHTSDLTAAQQAYDAAHPSVMPPRLAHLKVVVGDDTVHSEG